MFLNSLKVRMISSNVASPACGNDLDVDISIEHDSKTQYGPYRISIVDGAYCFSRVGNPISVMQVLLKHFSMEHVQPVLQLLSWDIRKIPNYIPHSLSGEVTFWMENSGWECNGGGLYECVHEMHPDEVVYVFQLNSDVPFSESDHTDFRDTIRDSAHWFRRYGQTKFSSMEQNTILLSIDTSLCQ